MRQLIGSAHWGHDGRHKELLLADVIRRHCPPTVLVTTGFVVSPVDFETRSSEQDILVLDVSREAPLFHQGGLAIAFPHTVMAAISVKSTMEPTTINSVVDGLRTIRNVSNDAQVDSQKIWCAGFFFNLQPAWSVTPPLIYASLQRSIADRPVDHALLIGGSPHIGGPNFIGDSTEVAFILDYERQGENDLTRIRGYNCGTLGTSVFLACLLEHVSIQLKQYPSIFSDLVTDLNIPQLDPPAVTSNSEATAAEPR